MEGIEGVYTVYAAEPICDDVRTSLPLELVVITFEARYYTSPAGWRLVPCI
jgi:eukaryotic translation initiation factor 2-alpha kinase 4